MSPYARIRTVYWKPPQSWSLLGQLGALGLFIAAGVAALLLLPPWYGSGVVCGLLFFLFALIRIEFGLYVVIVAMLLGPEVVVGQTGPREITLRMEDFLIVALSVAWALRSILDARGYLFRPTPLNRPIYSYLFFALFATVWGASRGHIEAKTAVFYWSKVLEFFLIFFLTVSCIGQERTVKRFIVFFLLVGLLIGVYGILQIGRVDRVSAPFEGSSTEPNTLGGYLTLVISLSLAIFLYAPRENIYYRAMSALATLLCFVALLFTLSRASFIGFLCMLVGMGLISRRYILLYAVAAILILAPLILPEEVLDRVNYTFSGPPGSEVPVLGLFKVNVDSSTLERFHIWRKVGFKFIRSPLWGYGLTAEQILDSQFARLLVEVGGIGTGLFIWILVRIFRCAWYVFKRSDRWFYRALALGYLAGYVGVLVHSLGTITFYIVRIMEPFWFFTGIIVYLYLSEKARQGAAPSEAATTLRNRSRMSLSGEGTIP